MRFRSDRSGRAEALAADNERLARRLDELEADLSRREAILTAMGEGVLLAHGAKVLYANPAATELFGGEPIERLPPQIASAAGTPGDRSPAVIRFALHHPEAREVRAVTTYLRDGSLLAILRDVTVDARTAAMRQDFVANASHEMKTPVAAILATAETLSAALEDDPEAARRFASTLVDEARSLSKLIGDLLDLARLDRLHQEREKVELSQVVEQQVGLARPFALSRGVSLEAEVAGLIVVAGSLEDLALLARNLLDNAIRYTPTGGSVSVALRADGAVARLQVRDTGTGIPQRDLPRVFERFYRVDRARARETGGTGLGLAMVRHVAESHGGSVTASSALGEGSVFEVTLPVSG